MKKHTKAITIKTIKYLGIGYAIVILLAISLRFFGVNVFPLWPLLLLAIAITIFGIYHSKDFYRDPWDDD